VEGRITRQKKGECPRGAGRPQGTAGNLTNGKEGILKKKTQSKRGHASMTREKILLQEKRFKTYACQPNQDKKVWIEKKQTRKSTHSEKKSGTSLKERIGLFK